MPPEKANNDGALAKQVGGTHVDMILIEQGEFRGAISDFEGSILVPEALSSAVARCVVSMASCGALYGGAPDSNDFLKSSKRD